MRQLIRICVVTLALGCATESAQAAEPVQPAAPAAAATPAPVAPAAATPAAPAADATQPAATSAQPAAPTQAADEPGEDNPEFQRVAKSYRQVEKDGQRLYCRTEKRLGTRLGSPVCLTEAQLWERIHKAESVRDQLRNKPAPCPPDRNCN